MMGVYACFLIFPITQLTRHNQSNTIISHMYICFSQGHCKAKLRLSRFFQASTFSLSDSSSFTKAKWSFDFLAYSHTKSTHSFIINKYKLTFSVLIYSYINTSGNWENEKLCGRNTTPGGRSVFTQFRVFPISTSVDITVYQYGKNVLLFL
jgi:hypothetical protein